MQRFVTTGVLKTLRVACFGQNSMVHPGERVTHGTKAAKNLTGRASEVRTPKLQERNVYGDMPPATHLVEIV